MQQTPPPPPSLPAGYPNLSYPNNGLITPSSEILQCLTTFADTVDALPPSLSRALSDLKELDAVLSGTLKNITGKLKVLLTAMYTPPPGSTDASSSTIQITPLERLRLLREITDEARVFRLGGDDKIRVATLTCETLATHTNHLSTLSSLLLTYLPSHLIPVLPAPGAPHGYPSSMTPASALARRQMFDYPASSHPGLGSTSRLNSARQMAQDSWDITRGGGVPRSGMMMGASTSAVGMTIPKRKIAPPPQLYDEREYSITKEAKEKDPDRKKHPNQYTKKKLQTGTGLGGGYGEVEKAAGGSTRGGGNAYPGMATAEEYTAATTGPSRATKRKVDDVLTSSKRQKKGPDDSPDVQHRTIPGSKSLKPPGRRSAQATASPAAESGPFVDGPDEMGEGEADDDNDGQVYCYCNRVSFGEMIACDGNCEREWFHLSCVGLQVVPKGRWLCQDCAKKAEKKKAKR